MGKLIAWSALPVCLLACTGGARLDGAFNPSDDKTTSSSYYQAEAGRLLSEEFASEVAVKPTYFQPTGEIMEQAPLLFTIESPVTQWGSMAWPHGSLSLALMFGEARDESDYWVFIEQIEPCDVSEYPSPQACEAGRDWCEANMEDISECVAVYEQCLSFSPADCDPLMGAGNPALEYRITRSWSATISTAEEFLTDPCAVDPSGGFIGHCAFLSEMGPNGGVLLSHAMPRHVGGSVFRVTVNSAPTKEISGQPPTTPAIDYVQASLNVLGIDDEADPVVSPAIDYFVADNQESTLPTCAVDSSGGCAAPGRLEISGEPYTDPGASETFVSMAIEPFLPDLLICDGGSCEVYADDTLHAGFVLLTQSDTHQVCGESQNDCWQEKMPRRQWAVAFETGARGPTCWSPSSVTEQELLSQWANPDIFVAGGLRCELDFSGDYGALSGITVAGSLMDEGGFTQFDASGVWDVTVATTTPQGQNRCDDIACMEVDIYEAATVSDFVLAHYRAN